MKIENRRNDTSRVGDHMLINDFCIPKACCPDRFPSPKLPSPTDCLPPNELEKVLEEIEAANELLLDLALDSDRSINETYQKVFDGLIGIRVEITNGLGETVEGKVTLSGFDFVSLEEEESRWLYPYSQIETIKPYGRFAEPFHEPELSLIDPCFRRDLTFHFGDVVSSSPELLHLFFRISLDVYLLLYVEKHVQVKTDESTIEGILADVYKDSIALDQQGETTSIQREKISLITFNKE
ncbi:hypothetical protein [Paenisporosarcina sp. TG-14]|uniref:hypothetical protein n=1 Tax=Paenisporosarcina sp. TG-14 TaxID=1231057 RepID=UPI00030A0B94|nr:hypothetical protein [Paenisporosarcina sp. TG-14]